MFDILKICNTTETIKGNTPELWMLLVQKMCQTLYDEMEVDIQPAPKPTEQTARPQNNTCLSTSAKINECLTNGLQIKLNRDNRRSSRISLGSIGIILMLMVSVGCVVCVVTVAIKNGVNAHRMRCMQ